MASRIAYLDGLVEAEVVLPSRLVLMENFRNPVEEDPLQAYVSKDAEGGQKGEKKEMMNDGRVEVEVEVEVHTR